MGDRLPHVLRSDAQENRDRVLDAAWTLFAEEGLGVTMRQVARRAGVGPATLYRRFPTRQALLDAAFDNEVRECRSIVEEGCAAEDPWSGFCSVVEGLSVLNVRNQGFTDAFTVTSSDAEAVAAHRRSLVRMLAALIKRAQDAGGLRWDVTVDDLVLMLLAVRGLSAVPLARRPEAARRFAVLAIDSFRAG